MKLSKTNPTEIEPLRYFYYRSLPEFQELYMEMLACNGNAFLLMDNNIIAGYLIQTADHILVEFYLKDSYIPQCYEIFKDAIGELQIEKVYCKSFDALLLNCCLMHSCSYTLLGSLFRSFIETEKYPLPNFTMRIAEESDLPHLLQFTDGLYETPQELETFVKGKNITLFYDDAQLAGCGYLIRIHKHYNFYDIGMWVNTPHRNKGIATKIISYLKETCLNNNWTPLCGCAYENTASQKTLEKNGFISKYKLIEFAIAK